MIDSGAFIALLDSDDDLHERAKRFYVGIPQSVAQLTTQAVIAECYTFFRYRVGAHAALRWLQYVDDARERRRLSVVYTGAEDGSHAERLLRRFTDQKISYVDALTLAAAARCHVRAIFGFDYHLSLGGVPLLPSS